MPFLHLCEDIFRLQLSLGGDASGENPIASASFRTKPISNILSHPEVHAAVSHGCRLGIKHSVSKKPLYKPTLWFSTAMEICDELAKRCKKDHEHAVCLGGKEITEAAGAYTPQIAKAICKGLLRVMKRKEPGNVRNLLRRISTRIRQTKNQNNRQGETLDLRWSEKTVKQALERWNAVFVNEQEGAGSSSSDAPMPSVPEDAELPHKHPVGCREAQRRGLRTGLHSDGISFEVPAGRVLRDEVKEALRKVHCNLGHPSPADLARFMKLGGAKQEAIEAISWMRCTACAHSQRPSTHRVSSIPPCQVVFGDEVQLDCIQIHDSDKQPHWLLSIIDRATSYHVVELMRDHSPYELHRAFDRGWSKWAGPPARVTVDFEGGFQGREFWEKVGASGSVLSSIAGTAHWQAGKVERHNRTIKDMLRTTIRQARVSGREEVRVMCREVAWAKNSLVREHGWSPVCLVFGREPRVYGELYESGNAVSYHPSVGNDKSDVAVRMRMRYHAKMEYMKSQARSMLMRTAHQRTRRITMPKVGQLVFFWREEGAKKRQSQSAWVGPGYVVGLQGHNAWVSCGGRCFLVAGEHLREAIGDEVHYGDPEIQKAIALFKKVPKEVHFEDLTTQSQPPEDEVIEVQPLAQDVTDDIDMSQVTSSGIPQSLAKLASVVGWHSDGGGNHVLVSHKAWAYRTPEGKGDAGTVPLRTTWAYDGQEWKQLENEVRWAELSDPHAFLPEGAGNVLVTRFSSRSRKDTCLEDVPVQIKKQRTERETVMCADVCVVGHDHVKSKTKLRRMMEKEIPYERIPEKDRPAYQEAEAKEWKSWLDYDSCEILSPEESAVVEREQPSRILPSRYVFRNKHAGLVNQDGEPLPVKAKARLCLQGHLCPDSQTGQVQVDSPTVERVSTMIFLHQVISMDWLRNWYIGDISNAFLQGAPLTGKPDMFMRQPKQGLAGMQPGQLLKLLKPVYGRPDAPRAWYDELSRILTKELGYSRSAVDPALFTLRDDQGVLRGMLIVHVDDVMACHDGSAEGISTTEKLHKRFPFGTWQNVFEQGSGINYCGKEIKIERDSEGQKIVMSQNGFIDGRLQPMQIDPQRKKNKQERATEEEKTDYRSTVGSLQWLSSQSRPDISFEVNQLQKRISDLRIQDMLRANKLVKEVMDSRLPLVFRNLGPDAEIITYHDAALYNSVGVEMSERDEEDILQRGDEKKLVYSQKGGLVGFVRKGHTLQHDRAHVNVIDWRSATNKRVVESSFAAETHAAIMAQGMARFSQVLSAEIKFGPGVVASVEDDGWQDLVPVTFVTDCRSIYDTVHKDGQHVSDKGNIVHAVLLRQLLSTRGDAQKANLIWVPTRCQLADALTKAGRSADLREHLREGALFHEKTALKRGVRPKRELDQCQSSAGMLV